jgi:hypothetical protein
VLAAIQLDRQFAFRAGKIHDPTPHRMLPAKLPSRISPQCSLEPLLDLGGVAPQPPCDPGSWSQDHAEPHLTLTLSAPTQGGEGSFGIGRLLICQCRP